MENSSKTIDQFCGLPNNSFAEYIGIKDAVEQFFSEISIQELDKLLEKSNFDFYNKAGNDILSLDQWIESIKNKKQKQSSRLFRGKIGKRIRIEDRVKYN